MARDLSRQVRTGGFASTPLSHTSRVSCRPRLEPLRRAARLTAIFRRPPLPRPTSFDFHLKRETQERPDQNNQRKHGEVLEGRSHGDRTDDVGGDEQFQAEQNPASEICSITAECRWPA